MKQIAFLSVIFFAFTAFGAETRTLYLSGHDKDDAVPWKFTCSAGRNANTPSTIRVPSNWELQGFGIFSYGVEHRGSKTKPAEPPTTVEGKYSTTFTPPAEWAGSRTFLVFEGVMTDTQASINGKSVGPTHQGGFYRFKYDVTSLVKTGESNTLEVTVDDESANASVNAAERRADYFNYAGIYRPVYLESVPMESIDRIAIDARADGSFSLDATVIGLVEATSVEAQIMDAIGKPAGNAFTAPIAKQQTTTRLQTKVENPKCWNAETPNLYTVEVRLMKGRDVVHTVHQRFGFRTMEVRAGDGVYVNGKRILFKGCDRHTFWPDSGRCTSEKISRGDIALMQEMNMNAVRMSHYPPDQHFLDACDEMGMYVLDEVAGWHGAYDDTVGHEVVRETVTRDVNHPCILFWDNGNESGWNTKLDGDFAQIDPQRRHVLHPWAKFDQVDTKHYPDYKSLTALAGGDVVYFPTEFLHGLYDGGAGAGLADYWEVIRKSKVTAGGFIWAFLDEAPKRVDLDGHLDTRGNLAPDGIVGPYREKEGSFFTVKELWSPVVITNKEMPTDGKFTIENRYSFTPLDECRLSYELRQFKSPADASAGFDVIGKGSIAAPSIAPGEAGSIAIDRTAMVADADALAIRIENPSGRELFTPVFALPHAAKVLSIVDGGRSAAAEIKSEDAESLTIQAADVMLTISKSTGYLSSATRGDKHFPLANGPRPVAGAAKLENIEHRKDGGDLLITARFSGALESINYRVHSNGWLTLDCAYSVTGKADFIGLGFDFPEADVKSLRWLGDGPYRVYKNRTAGPTLSVWQNDYNDSITGTTPWKYPEFKGYFSNIVWAQYQTVQGPITLLCHDQNTFLQNLVPAEPSKSLVGKTAVPYPPTAIAFLKQIPPVGSKFSSAAAMGPSAQSPIGQGNYSQSFSIYFGALPSASH